MQLHRYGLSYINQPQLVSVSSCNEHLGLVKTKFQTNHFTSSHHACKVFSFVVMQQSANIKCCFKSSRKIHNV